MVIRLNNFKYSLSIEDGMIHCRNFTSRTHRFTDTTIIELADPACFDKLLKIFINDLEYWENMRKY